jgi:hypothetical protein
MWEHIGYFSASIEEKDLDHIRQTMRAHGVHLQKSNDDPADNWQFFLLPKGSTRVMQGHRGGVPRYTVRLPDGYSFTLEMGPLNRDGFFTSSPLIFLDHPAEVQTEDR